MQGTGTIGIIGGGQLGRMLTLAALPLGFKVIVIDPSPDSPAKQAGAEQIVADLYDKNALRKLAERADYLTIEIEHLDADALENLGKPVNPAPQTIRLIQDKLAQKQFLQAAGIPVAPFVEITDSVEAKKIFKDYGGKMLIKARHGAYDGRGNMLIKKTADIDQAFKVFRGRKLYAEQFVPFKKELAVMAARDTDGNIAIYPVVETIHQRNICIEVRAPADISAAEKTSAEKIVRTVAGLLEGAGMFGIELFLTGGGEVLVNEIAPRVHNSGHYTMEAARTSQFEQHIRAISGLPLGTTDLVVPAAVMINILGERTGPTKVTGLGKALGNEHTSVHLYGKSPTKVDRKMGHITATGETSAEARKRAVAARQQLKV